MGVVESETVALKDVNLKAESMKQVIHRMVTRLLPIVIALPMGE